MVEGSRPEAYEQMFRALPDGAALFEIVRDRNGTPADHVFLDVNRAFQHLFGVGPREPIGRRVSETPFPGAYFGRLGEVATGGAAIDYETSAAEIGRQLRVSIFPAGNDRLVAVVRDVTTERTLEAERVRTLGERAQLEARAEWAGKLRDTEALFRTTVENMPVNLILYDRDYRILYLNPALARMCELFSGRKASEVIGRPGPEIWPPMVWNPLRAHSERAVATGERQTYELEVGSGRELTVRQWSVMPLRDGDGAVTQILAMSYDVTAQRRLVDELREADRRKSEFIAVLSHELRNPLAAMRSSLYVLERGAPGSAPTDRAREAIDRQVDHLVRMVDDLLDITRVARNKITLQRERQDLRVVVRATVEDHRLHLEDRGVHLKIELASAPVFVNVDGARMAQVVANLVSNAVKFTPPGGSATVSVSAEAGSALLRVADTGIGIDPALLPQLFEPFMQADRTLDRSGGGLGLGLALVKGLVELHGGEVEAHSGGVGRGTDIRVRLPLERGATPAPSPAAPAGRPPRRRVLIIEDDREVRDSLRVALELDEHEVAVAPTGPEGLEAAHRFSPEVVLCDIGLPGMTGYDVARAFRADPALRSAFLIALSGYAQADDLARAEAAGFDHHLAKPSTIARIQEAIAAADRRDRSSDRSSA
jgi:two-component system CheB/CheR fusion protein